MHYLVAFLIFWLVPFFVLAKHTEKTWWPQSVENRLVLAKDNRAELIIALNSIPKEQQRGMAFLIENMPDSDLLNIKASFLLENHDLAYKTKQQTPWGKEIPEALFFNNVLAYANLDEKRDPWRKEFYELCMPIIKSCKTPTEATQKLNSELFKVLKLKYAPQRRAPNLSPKESIAQGNASCTGLSIVLSDACRAVCIPTRIVGTPNWFDKRGNHTWIEIYDKGWHFTGACEPDPKGLDRGWFAGDASKAQHDSPEHAIYATSFRKTDIHFPLVWARDIKTVSGENITQRYAKKDSKPSNTVLLLVKVFDQNKKRIITNVSISLKGDNNIKFEGKSRGESSDLNDFLSFDLSPDKEYLIKTESIEKTVLTGKPGTQQILEFNIERK